MLQGGLIMTNKKAVLLLLIVVTILVLATPAAASRPELVGDRLSILPGNENETFPAGSPFHVVHGYRFLPGDHLEGGLGFDLWIDTVRDICRVFCFQ